MERASRPGPGGGAAAGDRKLADGFRRELRDLGAPGPGDGVVVALSGGLDSLVLLHLLRFESDLPAAEMVAAHLDHRMRPESPGDADWIRGLLRAWRIDGRFDRVNRAPGSEEDARRARYDFLRRVRRETGASWILTAHHADDQAETVLFRILRGTGVRGLRGIPRRRDPGILRPLLRFWKSQLRTYAGAVGIRPRFDESNLDRRFARNVLRHDVLPTVEAEVAPGARRALVRLARLARDEEAAWDALLPGLLEDVVASDEGRGEGSGPGPGGPGELPNVGEGGLVLDRGALLEHPPAVRARVLRRILDGVGLSLDESGTRALLAFTSESASGAEWSLPGGLVLIREFDHFVLAPAGRGGPDDPLVVAAPSPGRGEFTVGGRALRARWDRSPGPGDTWTETFSRSDLHFPIRFRGWNPGDRIRLPVGSRKLKKIFGEERIPVRLRHRWPVVSDAGDRVLWIPGLARSTVALPRDDDDLFTIGIADADHD